MPSRWRSPRWKTSPSKRRSPSGSMERQSKPRSEMPAARYHDSVPQYTRAGILKRGILCFWSLWISTVVVMNFGDLLRAAGILPSNWKLASGNYAAIVKVTAVYGIPRWVDWLLLLGLSGLET